MKRNTRKLISTIFITVFLLVAPLLLLYTMGYRYSLKRGSIQSTGALTLITIPKGSRVTMNGALQDGLTPAHLTQLAPGSYALKAEKEGFTPWQRQVSISAGVHTTLSPILLFPLSSLTPLALSRARTDSVRWNDSSSSWIITASTTDAQTFIVRNLALSSQTATVLSGELRGATAAPNDLGIAILHGDPLRVTILFLSLTEPAPQRTFASPESLIALRWAGDGALLGWNTQAAILMSLQGKIKERFSRPSILDADATPNTLLMLEYDRAEGVGVVSASGRTLLPREPLARIPLSPDSILIPQSPADTAIVHDRGRRMVHVITLSTQEITSFPVPAGTTLAWAADHATLAATSPHELAVIPWPLSKTPTPMLLTRIAEPLLSSRIEPSLHAMFYTTPTRLSFLHLNPDIDQEPHELLRETGMTIVGADAIRNRLIIKKGEQLFSYSLQTP